MLRIFRIPKIINVIIGSLVLGVLYGAYTFWYCDSNELYVGNRSPYLQSPSDVAITIRWRSEYAAQGVLVYGTSKSDLSQEIREQQKNTEHEIRLTNLQPDTRYYYRISQPEKDKQDEAINWFKTSPSTDQVRLVRFLVLGDPGQRGRKQDAVRDAIMAWLSKNTSSAFPYADFLVTTGDNAYRSGTDRQFQKHFFQSYDEIFKNISVWPAYGNHDSRSSAFFKLFTLPQHGESGGVPSGTEHYYSFDYANVHFVMLDSNINEPESLNTMLTWLRKDLATKIKADWIVTIFHHPPYTKGTHDSDNNTDSGGRMLTVREQIVPILENAGVDLVLSGHSHSYERSFLMSGHYGDSSTIKPHMIVDNSNKSIFEKLSVGNVQNNVQKGAIYAVVGSSAHVGSGSLDHPIMQSSFSTAGALVVEVNDKILVGRFIDYKGNILDKFQILKPD